MIGVSFESMKSDAIRPAKPYFFGSGNEVPGVALMAGPPVAALPAARRAD